MEGVTTLSEINNNWTFTDLLFCHKLINERQEQEIKLAKQLGK